jgi:hypothetical protein
MGTLREDICTFMIIYRSLLLKMRNVSDKLCRENQSTLFMFNNILSGNYTVFETMWKNLVESDKPQITISCCAEKM